MYRKLTALFISALTLASGVAMAQGYDDDDIYFNPSKAKKAKVEVKKQTSTPVYSYSTTPGADTYYVPASAGISRSVDDYNRRGFFATDTVTTDADSLDVFAGTRQIERFYNPDIVKQSGDKELVEIYYAQPANVNVYVGTDIWATPYYAGAWGYPYYSSWGYPYRYYSSWGYPWSWGPSWSWSWGYGPSWAWGPSWGWGYGPGWGWSHGPGWGHGPAWSHGPAWAGARPGAVGNVRPAGSFRPGSVGTYRPAGTSTGYRPGSTSTGYRPGRGNTRGSATNTNGIYTRGSSSSSYHNNNSSSGYRPNSTSSSPSWNSGSSGGFRGGSSGGATRGGGGGGRGRH